MKLPARLWSSRTVAMALGLLGTLAGAWVANALSPSQAPAASPFQWRGLIQAQYGPQFSPSQRRRLLRFMAANGFNAYVHAPKGDPYQRTLWREPYPAARQAALDSELRLAARIGIEWIPNVSPAQAKYSSPGDAAPPGISPSAPVCFSSDADLRQLLAKLQPFREAGATAFMVSFDDARRHFSCGSDAATYGKGPHAFGLATADLLDRLYQRLLAGEQPAQLLTVSSAYHGTRDNAYLSGFRERLAPGIDVMWTGPTVTSRQFAAADADSYGDLVGRAPVIWENWTANDLLTAPGRQPARIFLGPYFRPAKLAGHVGGFFFNLANQADLNFLPLATAGEWLRHPARYRPRRAFLRETRRLAGSQAPFLRAFAEANYSTTLRGSVEAPTLRRLIHGFLGARGHADAARAAARLRHQLRLAAGARRHLRRVARLRQFVRQARPFLRSVRLNARAGILATDLLQARHDPQQQRLRGRLRRALRHAARSPSQTYGSRTGIEGLTGNVIDRYAAQVRDRDSRRQRHRAHPGR